MLSSTETIFLYLAIFIVATFFAFKSQKVTMINSVVVSSFRKLPFFLSFIIPWFFVGFTNVGSDYESYSMIAGSVDMGNYTSFLDSEPGMNLTFIVLTIICGYNIDITLFLLKTITIVIVYFSIYLAKDHIRIGYSVLAYLLLFYLPSFYLLSISIASAIVSLAICIYTFKRKVFIPVLLVLIAGQLHNSCYIFFPAFVLCIFINKKGDRDYLKKLAIIAYIIVAVLSSIIFNFAQSHIEGFHYNFERENTELGFLLFILYIPLFYIVYEINRLNDNKRVNSMILVFALSSCLFRIMAYSFEVVERMEIVLTPLYSLLIPSVVYSTYSFRKTLKGNNKQLNVIFIAYLLFRGFLVVLERTTSESGVGNYVFFNPFN